MRITIVYHYFARYRLAVLKELFAKVGHDLKLVSSDGLDSGSIVSLNPGEFNSWEWQIVKNIWLYKNKWLYQKGVLSATKDSQLIIAVGSISFITTWLLLIVAKFRKQKVYLWTHGLYGRESVGVKKLRLLLYRLADGLLLYGNYAGKLLEEKGYEPQKIHIIYNSLDFKLQTTYYEAMDRESLSEKKKKVFGNNCAVLGFIGRLTTEKKLSLFLGAVKIIKEKGVLLNCLFIGDGEERERLEDYAKKNKINCHFVGSVYEESHIAPYLMLCDLVISPGNVGLTAIHSLAYGVPVITHNAYSRQGPEYEAIREGISGMFFEVDNVQSLADSIQKWLGINSKKTVEIEFACREIIQKFYSPEVQAEKILSAVGYNNENV